MPIIEIIREVRVIGCTEYTTPSHTRKSRTFYAHPDCSVTLRNAGITSPIKKPARTEQIPFCTGGPLNLSIGGDPHNPSLQFARIFAFRSARRAARFSRQSGRLRSRQRIRLGFRDFFFGLSAHVCVFIIQLSKTAVPRWHSP